MFAEIISGDRNNTAEWTYGIYPNGTATSFRPRAAAGEPDAQPASQPLVVAKKEKRDVVGDIFQTFGTLVNYDGWMEAVQHVDRLLPLTPAYGNPSVASPPDGLPPQTNTLVATQAAAPASNNATGGIAYHQIFRQTQQAWSEVNDQTEFGYWYYVTDNVASLTHQSGEDGVLRLEFVNNGCLNQSADPNFRNISERYPAFAFSKDLGNVTSTTQSTLFGLGLAQQYPIQFEGASNYAPQEAMYTQYFASDLDAVSWFFSDYATALPLGVSLDEKIQADSVAAHGQNLATITTLAYRQVYGAYQVTGNTSSPLVWQKEISSNGNMNTADVMFPASPLFLYLSPSWLKSLMLPLYIQQEAGKWPYSFALHDIGSHYPNATGHPDGNAEQMPVEESGNMIILALAYAQKAQDTQFLTDHYAILRQWNQYLIGEALLPGQQLSTDDFASSLANQTNLALKGIIGIAAMGQIANLTGHAADATNFSGIATQYIAEWQTLGINANATPPHSVLDYNNATSHGLLYNLYADRLLATQLVPQSVYDIQSAFYPTVANRYGVPLDTRASYTKSDWESWAAAIASNSTADLLYGSIATFIKENPTNRPFTDLFDTITGEYVCPFSVSVLVSFRALSKFPPPPFPFVSSLTSSSLQVPRQPDVYRASGAGGHLCRIGVDRVSVHL